MSLAKALGVSKNTPAAQAMIDLVDQTGYDHWIEYCKNLGYTDDVAEAFVEQYCIGGADMQASSREQASAYTIFANGGNESKIIRFVRSYTVMIILKSLRI